MTVSYEYDGNGLRESKIVDGIQHDYYYIDNVLMYEKSGNNYELFYRYDNNGRLSMITRYSYSNNSFAYYNVVTNTQGDVIAILNGAGSNVVNYTYDTFGKIVSIKNANGSVITSASNIGIQNSIRYRGYVYDSETNLYYLQSRYYDPDTGRFINCDDPKFIGVNDTFIGWNGFAYCENDWVNDTDPSGTISIVASLIIGAFVGLLALYFVDVIVNLVTFQKNMWKKTSSNIDYMLSALNGAISSLKTSRNMAIIISTVLSGASYVANCIDKGIKFNLISMLISLTIGAFCGVISGSGVDLKGRLGIIEFSNTKLKVLVSIRKISMYTIKIRNNYKGIAVGYIRSFISTIVGGIIGKIREKFGNSVANSVSNKLKVSGDV